LSFSGSRLPAPDAAGYGGQVTREFMINRFDNP